MLRRPLTWHGDILMRTSADMARLMITFIRTQSAGSIGHLFSGIMPSQKVVLVPH